MIVPFLLCLQLRRLKMVLANGTLLELSPKTNPHLFMAAGAAVGRLGVVTEVTLKIKPQQAIQRRLQVWAGSRSWPASSCCTYSQATAVPLRNWRCI